MTYRIIKPMPQPPREENYGMGKMQIKELIGFNCELLEKVHKMEPQIKKQGHQIDRLEAEKSALEKQVKRLEKNNTYLKKNYQNILYHEMFKPGAIGMELARKEFKAVIQEVDDKIGLCSLDEEDNVEIQYIEK
jgi:predicted nuclease with TOPRIM domain